MSSEVMRRIMAVTASQRLMSQKDKEKFILSFLNDYPTETRLAKSIK